MPKKPKKQTHPAQSAQSSSPRQESQQAPPESSQQPIIQDENEDPPALESHRGDDTSVIPPQSEVSIIPSPEPESTISDSTSQQLDEIKTYEPLESDSPQQTLVQQEPIHGQPSQSSSLDQQQQQQQPTTQPTTQPTIEEPTPQLTHQIPLQNESIPLSPTEPSLQATLSPPTDTSPARIPPPAEELLFTHPYLPPQRPESEELLFTNANTATTPPQQPSHPVDLDADETIDLSLFQDQAPEVAEAVDPTNPHPTTGTPSTPEDQTPKLPPVSFRTLFRYATKFDFFLVFFGTLCSLAQGFMLPLSSLLLGEILNKMQDPSEFEGIVKEICFIFFAFGVFSLICGQFQTFCFVLSAERQGRALREAYVRALYRQDISFFDTNSSAKDISIKITEFTSTVQQGLADKLGSLVAGMSSFIFALVLAFSKGWELSLVLTSPLPILIAIIAVVMARVAALTRDEMKAYGKANTLSQETFDNIRTVKSYNMKHHLIAKYNQLLDISYQFGISANFTRGLAFFTFLTLMFSEYAFGIAYGGLELIAKHKHTFGPDSPLYNGGLIIAIFYTLLSAMQSVGGSIPNLTAIAQARTSMAELVAVIDRPTAINPLDFADDFTAERLAWEQRHGKAVSVSSNGYTSLTDTFIFDAAKFNKTLVTRLNFTGSIKFDHVTFSYPSRPEQAVLKDFTFTFEKHTKYGIIGPSGSSKSTCLQLIQRFYDPNEGNVFVEIFDGINPAHPNAAQLRPTSNSPTKWVNLKDIYIGPWRKYVVGMVSQEPPLISGTIADNIRFGNPEASPAEVLAAAKVAHAHDFIMEKEGHYNMFLQEGALSGGQLQRIAIARTILIQPALLLLDEYTSAFDYKTEAVVSENIHSLFQSTPDDEKRFQDANSSRHIKTMITVAHRLVTVKHCDYILGMSDGKLVECDSPAALLQKPDSVFATMWNAHADPSLQTVSTPTSSSNITPISSPPGTPKGSGDFNSNIAALTAKVTIKPSNFIRSTDQYLEDQKKSSKITRSARAFRFSPLIFHIIKSHPILLFFAIISVAIGGASFPGFSYLFGHALKGLYAPTIEELKKEIKFYSLLFFGFAFAAGINAYCTNVFFGIISEKVIRYFREELFASILGQEMGFFDQEGNNTGTLTTKLAKDTSNIRMFISQFFQSALSFLAQLIISVVMSYHISPKMTFISCAIFPLTVLSSYLHFTFVRGFAGRGKEHLENSGVIAVESMKNIRTISTFNAENWTFIQFSLLQDKALSVGMLSGLYGGFGFGLSQFLFYTASSCTYWFGGQLVIDNELAFNEFFQIFQTMRFCSQQFSMLLAQVSTLDAINAAVSDMYELIERKSLEDVYLFDAKEAGENPITAGKVAFRNVKFHYPTKRDRPVLRGISFSVDDIQHRKSAHTHTSSDADSTLIAIVGKSGEGKSTIINLLLQFYIPIQPNGNDRLILKRKADYYNKFIRPKYLKMLHDEENQTKKNRGDEDLKTALLGNDELNDDDQTSFLSSPSKHQIHQTINDAQNSDFVVSMPTEYSSPNTSSATKVTKKLEDMSPDERYLYSKQQQHDFEHGGELRDPDASGQIFIDGHDLLSIPAHKLYEKVGYVSQSPQIFNETVHYNISNGDGSISREKVIECAKMAQIHDVIMKLPKQYDTVIDSKKLSTGQKQRVRIAAALVRDPSILLIDEAFSGLDNINSKRVNVALQSAMKGKVTFSIAHRLETVQNADQILVIENGLIMERGTHNELIQMSASRVEKGQAPGLYAGLIASTLE